MIFSTVSSFITHLLLIFATKMVNENNTYVQIHNFVRFERMLIRLIILNYKTKKCSQLQIKHEIMIFSAD